MNYDPKPEIAVRVGNIRKQWEPRDAQALVRGLYQRFRIEPRIVPAALEAFRDAVRKHFPAAEAAAILK